MKTNSMMALLCGASLAILGAGAAQAADAVAVATVDPIIVTAQRVSQNLQDVPASVTAISGEKLDVLTSSGGDIRVLSSRVPSLILESSFGRTFPRPYIRGLGNTDFDLNASQPVSFVYDDIVLENPILKGLPLFDIAQVEVLRGPQGTLFGRNTPAGVLKFDSARPTDTFEGYASGSWASYNTVNVEGAVSGPIIKGVLDGRISGLYQGRDNWVDNTFTGQNNVSEGYAEYAVRGQLKYTPNASVTALLSGHYMHLNGTPRLFRANIIKLGGGLVDGFDRSKIAQDAQTRSFQHVTIYGANLHVDVDLGGPKLSSITGFERAKTLSHGDIDGGFGAVFAPPSGPGFIPFASESADGLPYHQQLSQEVRIAQDVGKLHYQAGAFYFFEDVKIDSFDYDTLGGGVLDGFARQHQKTRAWALFGTVSYDLTDALSVTGGLRYSNDKKDFEAQRYIGPFGSGSTPLLTANPKSDDITWNVSATYKLTPDVNLYGRVAKGYRAPSIQGRLVFSNALSIADTETVISYEGGVKSYLFDRRLRLNADAFYYRVNNIQLTAVGGATNANRLLNGKHAEGYGFEMDLEAKPVENLLMTAGLSYNHTKLDDAGLATVPCTSGCTVLDPAGALPGTVSIDGNPLPNAPKWIGNVTARYGIPFGDGEFFAYTDWAYRSKINFFLYQSAEYQDKHLLEGGVRVGYSYKEGKYEVAFFGRNITNDTSLEGGIDFDNLTGFVNEPRIWGVEGKAKF